MINLDDLLEIQNLLNLFPKTEWKCHDKRIDDESQKWVIWQAGFDGVSDQRLELIVKVMNCLPDLLNLAREKLENETTLAKDSAFIDELKKIIKDTIKQIE